MKGFIEATTIHKGEKQIFNIRYIETIFLNECDVCIAMYGHIDDSFYRLKESYEEIKELIKQAQG